MAGKRGVARGWLARADLGITGKGVRVSMDGFWKRGRASEFARGCSRERARNDWTVSRGGVARGASREGLRARTVKLREFWTALLLLRASGVARGNWVFLELGEAEDRINGEGRLRESVIDWWINVDCN